MNKTNSSPHAIRCPTCNKVIYSGGILRARITDFSKKMTRAKCRQCKTWVDLPQVHCFK